MAGPSLNHPWRLDRHYTQRRRRGVRPPPRIGGSVAGGGRKWRPRAADAAVQLGRGPGRGSRAGGGGAATGAGLAGLAGPVGPAALPGPVTRPRVRGRDPAVSVASAPP
ncbi:MAG: hypothetical protein ACK52I_20115 [Pseudomonadota bacterium]